MNITCSGTIVAVRIVGRWRPNGTQIPRIQIWRTTDKAYYDLSQHIVVRPAACAIRQARVFECKLTIRHSVQSGDSIGFRLPPKNVSKFELYFMKSTAGPTNYIFSWPQKDRYSITNRTLTCIQLPQIRLQIEADTGQGRSTML